MKKLVTSIALFCAVTMQIWAANYVVSGFNMPWNEQYNGTYVEAGVNEGQPYFKMNGQNYFISYSMGQWVIGEGYDGNVMMDEARSSDAGSPPLTGWNNGVSIQQEGKAISYKGESVFIESDQNNGEIYGKIIVSINKYDGEMFTGANGTNYLLTDKAFVTNLPAGLEATLLKENDSTLTFTISGKATSHTKLNNVSNVSLTFLNAALTGADTSLVAGYSKNNIVIKFRNYYTVASSGADFTTITAAFNAVGEYDIIDLAAETFTEANLTLGDLNKGVIIRGKGIDKTIVQAAAAKNIATSRVIKFEAEGCEIHSMTIRYGKFDAINMNYYGAGVQGNGLSIYNCKITDNVITSNALVSGGGVSGSDLYIYNSEISNNSITCSNNSNIYGAGINTNYNLTLINSTVSGNILSSTGNDRRGGGVYSNGGKTVIINSTITNNTAYFGAGYYSSNGVTEVVKNSIIYGNTEGEDFAVNTGYGKNSAGYNSIVGNSSLTYFNIAAENMSTSDPLLLALTNNGTHELQSGSPAIDAGTAGDDIPTKDQIGKFANGTRDIGAFEFNGLVCLKPVITQDISDVTVCKDAFVNYKIAASGDTLKYAWGYTNLVDFQISPDEKADTVQLSVSADFNGYYIFATVSNGCGSDTSSFSKLTVNSLDTTVTLSSGTLTATIENATYQWINTDGNEPVVGENSISFTPQKSGTYKVAIEKDGCVDTSGSKYVEVVIASLESVNNIAISVYPNPASNLVTVSLSANIEGSISITDIHGNKLLTKDLTDLTTTINTTNLSSGIYVIKINSSNLNTTKQLLIVK